MGFLRPYFDCLSEGNSVASILETFRAEDAEIASRQIGLIAFDGEALAFTGERCSFWAGHKTGEDYACQGNTLVGPAVVDAMVEAFEQTDGALYARLYAALAAGDAAGGDIRGKQSARLAVKKKGYGQPDADTFLDIAIEDHAEPVQEIGRILQVGGTLMQILGMLEQVSQATDADKKPILDELRGFLDDKRECKYLDWWESLAMGYHAMGEVDLAVAAFQIYLAINPALSTVLKASAAKGQFPIELASALL
jgi:uncharacterized Ntn-hydrolase superfamily protein